MSVRNRLRRARGVDRIHELELSLFGKAVSEAEAQYPDASAGKLMCHAAQIAKRLRRERDEAVAEERRAEYRRRYPKPPVYEDRPGVEPVAGPRSPLQTILSFFRGVR